LALTTIFSFGFSMMPILSYKLFLIVIYKDLFIYICIKKYKINGKTNDYSNFS